MKKYFILLSLFLCTYLAFAATTEKVGRWIDIEWDEVKEAKGYDIELFEIIDNKEYPRGIFHTEIPRWAKETGAGKYKVKMRALDNRKIPGPWGEAIPVTVKLMPPQLLRPLNNETLTSTDINDLSITFQWSLVPGAALYQLVVFNSKNQIVLNEMTKEIEAKFKLLQIDNYKWYVVPMFTAEEKKAPQDFLSNKDESLRPKSFAIKGTVLQTPAVQGEVSQKKYFVFRWVEVFRAENYFFEVFKEEGNKELKKIFSASNGNKRQITIGKDKLPIGRYLVTIKAQAHDYQDSENVRIVLKTEKDNLEIVSIEMSNKDETVRSPNASTIEGHFGYPTFNYTSKHYETDTSNQEALRGVRVMGKWEKSFSNNRFQNLIKFDISQIADTDTEAIFFSFSENIGKAFVFNQSQFLLAAGLRFDSTPLIYADRFQNIITSKSYLTLGPELNLKYNYRWNPLLSGEATTSFFSPMVGISSPDGSRLKSSLSYEAELKFRFTIHTLFDVYTGLNYTNHSFKSAAITGGTSVAVAGDINEINFTSTHLIFGAELFY